MKTNPMQRVRIAAFGWIFAICAHPHLFAQPAAKPAARSNMTEPVFFAAHPRYREARLSHRRFKHHDLQPLLDKLRANPLFKVELVGHSVQGRSISLITVGTGPTKVFLWSQMHGDEPTATMALFDVGNFLAAHDDLDPLRKQILARTTLYLLPMLNPDGAEVYQRRNAQDIDLNRDARTRRAPEAQLLWNLRNRLSPDFGFNLHDQNPRYSAGHSAHQATISFLAPAYNPARDVNPVRTRAMQLIALLNRTLQTHIPAQVGRYADDHEPRGFGDNIQGAGTSTVLVESGGYHGDPEKQHIRRLNFALLLTGLQSIATGSYAREKTDDYFAIPPNERDLFDLVVRGAKVEKAGKMVEMDVAYNRAEVSFKRVDGYFYRSAVEDLGDLSVYHGLQELNARGLTATPGQVYPTTLPNGEALKSLDFAQLLADGYTAVRVARFAPAEPYTPFPTRVLTGQRPYRNELELGQNPDLVLRQGGRVRYAVVNGFVYDLAKMPKGNKNAGQNGLVE